MGFLGAVAVGVVGVALFLLASGIASRFPQARSWGKVFSTPHRRIGGMLAAAVLLFMAWALWPRSLATGEVGLPTQVLDALRTGLGTLIGGAALIVMACAAIGLVRGKTPGFKRRPGRKAALGIFFGSLCTALAAGALLPTYKVSVTATPASAVITLDGKKYKGQTGPLKLQENTYTVTVSAPNYRPTTRVLDFRERRTFTIALTPFSAAELAAIKAKAEAEKARLLAEQRKREAEAAAAAKRKQEAQLAAERQRHEAGRKRLAEQQAAAAERQRRETQAAAERQRRETERERIAAQRAQEQKRQEQQNLGGVAEQSFNQSEADTSEQNFAPVPAAGIGLDEHQRRSIFTRLAGVEADAMEYADRLIPIDVPGVTRETLVANIELQEEYKNKLKSSIRSEYNLTDEQLDSIAVEGVSAGWSLPQ